MKKNNYIVIIIISIFIILTIITCPSKFDQKSFTNYTSIWLTDNTGATALQNVLNTTFSSGSGSNLIKVKIDKSKTYQQMDGFGASLTDSSAWVINNFTNNDYLISKLFSAIDGIGINYIRLPMGASDYSKSAYTYDDSPGDACLTNFSISHDLNYIIPVLRKSFLVNSFIKVIAVPWTAPAWMKTPATLNGGALNSIYQETYADYFIRFMQEYKNQGINIDFITIQNEPEFTTANYPSMFMSWNDQTNFIKILYNKIIYTNLNANFLIYDHNRDKSWYPINIYNDLSNDSCFNRIAGSAWHAYEDSVPPYVLTPETQTTVNNAYPNKGIYFTERSASGTFSFETNLQWSCVNLFINNIRNYAKTVLLWNFALDTAYGPLIRSDNPLCRGLIMIDTTNDKISSFEPEYYVMGHFSKFIQRYAYFIDSTTDDANIESLAFINPDGAKVLVILNTGNLSKSFDILWNDKYLSYTLSNKSLMTAVWY